VSDRRVFEANAVTGPKNRTKDALELNTKIAMNLIAGDTATLDFVADKDAQRLSSRHIGQNGQTNSVSGMVDTHLHVRTARGARRHRESRGVNPDFLASGTNWDVRAGMTSGRGPLDPGAEAAVMCADKIAQFPETTEAKLAKEGLV
jgi:hypothetical protein